MAWNPTACSSPTAPATRRTWRRSSSWCGSCGGRYPIFGICLGHQMIALAYGGRTYKLKFGHRGGNHPVKNLLTGKMEITSQNHSYAVDRASLAGTGLEVTHVNLLDNTVEGLACPGTGCSPSSTTRRAPPGPRTAGICSTSSST